MRKPLMLSVVFGVVVAAACSSESATDLRVELIEPVADEVGQFTATGGAVDDASSVPVARG